VILTPSPFFCVMGSDMLRENAPVLSEWLCVGKAQSENTRFLSRSRTRVTTRRRAQMVPSLCLKGNIMRTIASSQREFSGPRQSSDLRLIIDAFKHMRLVSGCEA
jgi:hypothetical protein